MPPTEHWRGHLDVARPAAKPGRSRAFFLILVAALGGGLLTLGGLALWSRLAGAPDVFAWGVVIVSLAALVITAAFLLPLPVALNSTWVAAPRLWGPEPLPLVTPALAAAVFAAPSAVALIVLIVASW